MNGIELQKPGPIFCATDYTQKIPRKIITSFKYDLLRNLDWICAEIMVKFLEANNIKFKGDEILAFVPMHPVKKSIRGFNQSELIAQKLSMMLELPTFPLLTKTRKTSAQMTLNRVQRLTNLVGAFKSSNCQGRTVILIDDVVTTGATLIECEKSLVKAGAAKVIPFAFCRDKVLS
jgi:competence protein ComFC